MLLIAAVASGKVIFLGIMTVCLVLFAILLPAIIKFNRENQEERDEYRHGNNR